MRILLTGSSGHVGRHTLLYLLQRTPHTIHAVDIAPLAPSVLSPLTAAQRSRLTTSTLDLCDFHAVDDLFRTDAAQAPIDAITHLGAIPRITKDDDPRVVHNNNVTSSWNVLRTAVDFGVKRIVQASSVNAMGLSFTPKGHQRFDELPIREDQEMRPQDPYALSKQFCELQALSLTRTFPDVRIASLRFHLVKPTIPEAVPHSEIFDLWSWVSTDACARACLLGLTSEGWSGAEAFNIVGPDIIWEGQGGGDAAERAKGTLELLEEHWNGRYAGVRPGWFGERKGDEGWRRACWDTAKAERMLGWRHEVEGDGVVL